MAALISPDYSTKELAHVMRMLISTEGLWGIGVITPPRLGAGCTLHPTSVSQAPNIDQWRHRQLNSDLTLSLGTS